MKFLFSWLKEFIELSLPPQTLAERLTLAGLEVTSLEQTGGDWLFEAEVTPNRPDWLSHLGIARETAAVLGRPFRFPRRLLREMRLPEGRQAPVKVSIQEPAGCRRYIGIVIDGVKVGTSPPEIVERLKKIGIRSVNNVVDATNLCLMELGQPLHAFDLETLSGLEIQVRRARAGEKLTAIDGQTLNLSTDLLVIADSHRPVALAGVMGGKETEITFKTKRVFLESAFFEPAWIRRAVRVTKLASDSSYRFERGVDPEMVKLAAVRTARLIARLGGGNIRAGLIEAGEAPEAREPITLKPKKAQETLGVRSTASQQRRMLESLGCHVKGSGQNWRVQPPSWRSDLKIPEDLYEELARLVGFDKCQPTLPPTPRVFIQDHAWRLERSSFAREADIRRLMAAAGYQEVMTYSLLSAVELERLGIEESPLKLKNPLSLDYCLLRKTLLAGALATLARNVHHKTGARFQFFEIGDLYPNTTDAASTRTLGILSAGAGDLFDLKGALALLWERLGVSPQEEHSAPSDKKFLTENATSFLLDGKPLAFVGQIKSSILSAYDLPPEMDVFYAELLLEPLLSSAKRVAHVTPLPKVPAVERDIAIVVDDQVTHEQLQGVIQQAGEPLLKQALFFDLYKGKQVPSGKKSLAYRLSFSAGDRTLTEEEIAGSVAKIVKDLEQIHQATLRQ